MDSPETYLAKKTKKLAQIATLFEQIISQEVSFLKQLTSFTKMLHDAKIFTTPVPIKLTSEPCTHSSKPKRSISQFDSFVVSNYQKLNNENVFVQSLRINRTKRISFDICTPYSINDLGNTASQNYKLVNITI